MIDRLILPTLLDHPRPIPQRDLVLGPALHRRTIGFDRDLVIADGRDLLDQQLAGRIVPAVNRVGGGQASLRRTRNFFNTMSIICPQ